MSAIGMPAAGVRWQFTPPEIPGDYYGLAARLVERAESSEPRSLLLTAVSRAAFEAVSLAALAAVLSNRGNVLWVDTQHTRPSRDALGLPDMGGSSRGWQELRAGKVAWTEIISPTNLPGVSFVGCGERMPAAGRDGFDRQLFEPLRSAFSTVLIGGGLLEDTASLVPFCGAIGLITAIGQTTHGQVETALRALGAAGCGSPLIIAVESGSL